MYYSVLMASGMLVVPRPLPLLERNEISQRRFVSRGTYKVLTFPYSCSESLLKRLNERYEGIIVQIGTPAEVISAHPFAKCDAFLARAFLADLVIRDYVGPLLEIGGDPKLAMLDGIWCNRPNLTSVVHNDAGRSLIGAGCTHHLGQHCDCRLFAASFDVDVVYYMTPHEIAMRCFRNEFLVHFSVMKLFPCKSGKLHADEMDYVRNDLHVTCRLLGNTHPFSHFSHSWILTEGGYQTIFGTLYAKSVRSFGDSIVMRFDLVIAYVPVPRFPRFHTAPTHFLVDDVVVPFNIYNTVVSKLNSGLGEEATQRIAASLLLKNNLPALIAPALLSKACGDIDKARKRNRPINENDPQSMFFFVIFVPIFLAALYIVVLPPLFAAATNTTELVNPYSCSLVVDPTYGPVSVCVQFILVLLIAAFCFKSPVLIFIIVWSFLHQKVDAISFFDPCPNILPEMHCFTDVYFVEKLIWVIYFWLSVGFWLCVIYYVAKLVVLVFDSIFRFSGAFYLNYGRLTYPNQFEAVRNEYEVFLRPDGRRICRSRSKNAVAGSTIVVRTMALMLWDPASPLIKLTALRGFIGLDGSLSQLIIDPVNFPPPLFKEAHFTHRLENLQHVDIPLTALAIGAVFLRSPQVWSGGPHNEIIAISKRVYPVDLVIPLEVHTQQFTAWCMDKFEILFPHFEPITPLTIKQFVNRFPVARRASLHQANEELIANKFVLRDEWLLGGGHVKREFSPQKNFEEDGKPRIINTIDDHVSVLLGPWFVALANALALCWNHYHFIVMPFAYTNSFIGNIHDVLTIAGFLVTEGDFSTFDATQGFWVTLLLVLLYRRFGVPQSILDQYMKLGPLRMYTRSGVGVNGPAFNRSGINDTYIRNCLLNGLVNAYAIRHAFDNLHLPINAPQFPPQREFAEFLDINDDEDVKWSVPKIGAHLHQFSSEYLLSNDLVIVVAGDDNLIYVSQEFLINHVPHNSYTMGMVDVLHNRIMSEANLIICALGLKNVMIHKTAETATFCSGIFVPAIVNAGVANTTQLVETRVMTTPTAYCLYKLPWVIKPIGSFPFEIFAQKLMNISTAAIIDPFLRAYNDAMQPLLPSASKKMTFTNWATCTDYYTNDLVGTAASTNQFYFDRYNLTSEDLSVFVAYCGSIRALPHFCSDGRITSMLNNMLDIDLNL
jgi:hypothetical protein